MSIRKGTRHVETRTSFRSRPRRCLRYPRRLNDAEQPLTALHGGSMRIRSSVNMDTIVLVHVPGLRDAPTRKLLHAAGATAAAFEDARRGPGVGSHGDKWWRLSLTRR